MPANEETMEECLCQEVDCKTYDNTGLTLNNSNGTTDKSVYKNSQNGTKRQLANDEELLESLRSFPSRREHEKFIRDSVNLILNDAVFEGLSRKSKVVEWVEPQELKSLINFNLPEDGVSQDDLLNLAKSVIKYSVKTGHPHFVNQLFSGLDPYALVAQWLTDALNSSIYTYEVSPVFSLMEDEVLREMRRIVGWKDGKGDGVFCPGGSMANGYAISLARHNKFPKIKETGLFQLPRLIVFTSEDAHYSVQKLASFMGIGMSNVFSVKVDSRGKMCVKDLEKKVQKALEEGAVPLMVSATSGTTVLGAFDPLLEIKKICDKYQMWFHVDAAWGGGALMSRKYRHLLDGIQFSDSVTWNPHKMLSAPQQCSTFLTCHENLMQPAHGAKATYLFQKDKFYDTSYDVGDKIIQCGRRVDVFKFWFMWKAKGTTGFEKHVNRVFELSRYFLEMIRNRNGWQLLLEPECTNVCFRYIPPSKRHLSGEQLLNELHKVAPKIKERMVKKGSMLITYQPLRHERNFFRIVFQNSALNEEDIQFFVEEIERLSVDV